MDAKAFPADSVAPEAWDWDLGTSSGGMRFDLWPDIWPLEPRLKPGLPFSLWDPCRAIQLDDFSRSWPVLAGRPRGLDTCHGCSLCDHLRILSLWKLESLRMPAVPSWCAFISSVWTETHHSRFYSFESLKQSFTDYSISVNYLSKFMRQISLHFTNEETKLRKSEGDSLTQP